VHRLSVPEYGDGVLEIRLSTPIPSEVVKPYRVKESPVQFECKVTQIIPQELKVELGI
jgi:hypothetical protein